MLGFRGALGPAERVVGCLSGLKHPYEHIIASQFACGSMLCCTNVDVSQIRIRPSGEPVSCRKYNIFIMLSAIVKKHGQEQQESKKENGKCCCKDASCQMHSYRARDSVACCKMREHSFFCESHSFHHTSLGLIAWHCICYAGLLVFVSKERCVFHGIHGKLLCW